jgi:hypothetical protein
MEMQETLHVSSELVFPTNEPAYVREKLVVLLFRTFICCVRRVSIPFVPSNVEVGLPGQVEVEPADG